MKKEDIKLPNPDGLDKARQIIEELHNKEPSDEFFEKIEATEFEEAEMPTEFKITVFVGVDGKFVLVKGFDKSDENLGGLHEMLDEFLGYDDYLSEEPLEMGFYEVELDIEQDALFNPEKDMSDAYFVVKKIEKKELNKLVDEMEYPSPEFEQTFKKRIKDILA